MSDLFAYLGDCSGPEYAHLGHFKQRRYLEQGHNDLPLAREIEAGEIPDLSGNTSGSVLDRSPGRAGNTGGF